MASLGDQTQPGDSAGSSPRASGAGDPAERDTIVVALLIPGLLILAEVAIFRFVGSPDARLMLSLLGLGLFVAALVRYVHVRKRAE